MDKRWRPKSLQIASNIPLCRPRGAGGAPCPQGAPARVQAEAPHAGPAPDSIAAGPGGASAATVLNRSPPLVPTGRPGPKGEKNPKRGALRTGEPAPQHAGPGPGPPR